MLSGLLEKKKKNHEENNLIIHPDFQKHITIYEHIKIKTLCQSMALLKTV